MESNAKKSPVVKPTRMCPLSYGPYYSALIRPLDLNGFVSVQSSLTRSNNIRNGRVYVASSPIALYSPAKIILRGNIFCDRCIVSNSRSCQSRRGISTKPIY